MVTRTGTPQLQVAIVTMLSVMVLGLGSAAAQQPADITCATFPPGSPWQTIGVELVGSECKIDLDTRIELLRTFPTGVAYWDVCNKCGAPVDVKIFGSAPYSLEQLFSGFSPLIDASGTSTAMNIPPGQRNYFRGDVGADAAISDNKYSVAVKFSGQVGGWDELDPELQIDDYGRAFDYVAWLIGALIGVVFGFGGGWWFARRRVTL